MSFETKQWHKSIINLGTLFGIAEKRERIVQKCKSSVDEKFMATPAYIMNEYFQQLKCKKEGLCVYAVLKVNLFIADPKKSRLPAHTQETHRRRIM